MPTNKMNINGIAIRPGLSLNKIYYSAEELVKFAPTLINKPILKDHQNTTDNTVGLVEDSSYIGNAVNYSGWVKEDGTNLLEKIQDKRVKEVSIGAVAGRLVKENESDDFFRAKDLKGIELSLTPTPGVNGTSLAQTLSQIESIKIPSDWKNVKPVVENLAMINESFKVIKMDKKIKEQEEPIEVPDKQEEPIVPKEQGDVVKCPYCDIEFGNKEDMKKHISDVELPKELDRMKVEMESKIRHNIKQNIKEEAKKMEEAKLKEMEITINEKMKVIEIKEQELKIREEKIPLITEYKTLCSERGVLPSDIGNVGIETLKVLVNEIKKIPIPKTEEKAETKGKISQDTKSDVEKEFSGFVIEKSEFGRGYALFKESYDSNFGRLHREDVESPFGVKVRS